MNMVACLKEVLPPNVDAADIAAKMEAKGYSIAGGPPEGDMPESDDPTGEVAENGAPTEGEPTPSDVIGKSMRAGNKSDDLIRSAVASAIDEKKKNKGSYESK